MTDLLALVIAAATLVPSSSAVDFDDMFPAWSPDGRRVVFTSNRDGDPEIYVVDVEGGAARRLTSTPGRDAHPSWSPDGRRIAFQSPRRDGATQIYVMAPDGSGQRPISDNRGFCGMPVWSPDGRQLAFQCSDDPQRPGRPDVPWRIFVMDATGGKLRQVTHGPGNDQVANWSPDGRVVFHSDRTGADQLYVVDVAGGSPTALTRTPGAHRNATLSPDGRRVVFLSDRDAGQFDIHVMQLDGSQRRRLSSSGLEHGLPFFSPDGRRLLFQDRVDGLVRIRIMDATGGSTTVLRTWDR